MHRRVLSIALYFCATSLTFLFVAQLAGGFLPALQIQYWPVALSALYAIAAFLLPEVDSHEIPQGRFLLRCVALILFFLSPFPVWTARLSTFGVGFVPIGRHIYLQMGSVAELFVLALFLTFYSSALREFYGVKLRFLGRRMLEAPLWFMIVPAVAVLAGIALMMILDSEARFPLRMVPNILWVILCRTPGSEICETLCCMTLATHALGVLCVICAKQPVDTVPVQEITSVECPKVLESIAENAILLKQEENQNDETD